MPSSGSSRPVAPTGRYAGLGGVHAPPLIERYVGVGFRFILAGSDLSFTLAAAEQGAASVRRMRSS